MWESCNTFILKIPSSFNQFSKQDIIGFFHLLLAWHFQWLEPDIWAKVLKLPGETWRSFGAGWKKALDFAPFPQIWKPSSDVRLQQNPSFCVSRFCGVQIFSSNATSLGNSRDAKDICHLFQSRAFSAFLYCCVCFLLYFYMYFHFFPFFSSSSLGNSQRCKDQLPSFSKLSLSSHLSVTFTGCCNCMEKSLD